MMQRRRFVVIAVVTLAFIALSCARDVGLVDRTQPGKLKKSAYTGEWYYRQAVTDVPYATGVTFIGEQSYLERIRWEISEDVLTAYRSYERVQGSERPSTLPGTEYQGAPVAAFRILKHFDVFREYNPATGEQTNVLVENDYDRPWYEREYFRVEWSQNLLANFDFLAGADQVMGVQVQGASYAVTDPDDPDAPVFGVRDGSRWIDHRDPAIWGSLERFDYFDLTQKLQVTPETFLLEYDDGTTEEWPACWFYEWGPWDCSSQTIKVRASFLRVTDSDYEPLHFPDNYVARDGQGNPVRTMWDEGLGRVRRCTVDEGPDCTPVRVPMFDWFGYFRTERESYDRDYEVTEEGRLYLINRFNLWQRSVAADGSSIPYAERQVKPIVYYLPAGFPEDLMPAAEQVGRWWNEAFQKTVQGLNGRSDAVEAFKVVRNSYKVDNGRIVDHGQRNGDLRYSHLYWVDDPQFESLLGYGPSAADPLSGELIAGDAYVYGAAIDSYAVMAADIIDLMRGEISEAEFIDGENVGSAIARIANRPGISSGRVKGRVQETLQKGLDARLRDIRHAGSRAYRVGHDVTAARLRMADDQPLFEPLWNDEMRLAFEARLGQRLPLSSVGAGRLAKALQKHRLKLGARAVDLRSFDDAAVLHLVDQFGDAPRAQVIQTLRENIFKSTATHEIGHTVGLRHNFAGSADALNYFDGYWDIRDPAAQALDLPTRGEMQQGLRELAYSSIMDYGAKFMSDIQGLGKYDIAAIKFGYGQLVERFTNPPSFEDHDQLLYYNLDQAVQDWVHYTELPALFDSGRGNGLANMRNRSAIPMREVVRWLINDLGAPDLTDTLVPYKFCSDEYVGAQWDCDVWDEGADPYEVVTYATRSYEDYYIFHAFKRNRRYLDPFAYYDSVFYNTMMPLGAQYHLWLWDQWTKWGEWEWLRQQDSEQGTSVTSDLDWNLDPKGGLSSTAASMHAMNFLGEVLSTPEPGSYWTDPDSGNLLWWTYDPDALCEPGQNSAVDPCSDLVIPVGPGRYALSDFDADSGYYWYERVRVVGSFWDKLAAVETLSDPTTYFLGVDDIGNASAYALGFNVAFPRAVSTIFGAVINDDYKKYAPQLESDGSFSLPNVFDTIENAFGDVAPGDRPGPFVDPATNFTVSIYTMFYGMALLNASFDQSFNDGAKIWLEGSGEAMTTLPGADVASFINPFNGRSYRAQRMPDAQTYSLGYEMVSRAQGLADSIAGNSQCSFTAQDDPCSGQRWELRSLIENIELVRGYYDFFGYAWW